LGISGALQECLGWWNLNICFLFSAYLSTDNTAAQVVLIQMKNITEIIPMGISFVASQLVGNLIGMEQIQRAKNYSEVAITFSMMLTAILIFIFMCTSKHLSMVFTDDHLVAHDVDHCFWSLFLYVFIFSIKGVQNGTIRALEM
jgi:Na+-driven multidrug efflux pump